MPLFASNTLNMSSTQLGSLFAGMALINVAFAQPFAWMSDKYGRKAVIVPSSLILAASCFAVPLVTNINELTILWTVWAFGSTMLAAGPLSYISDNNDSSKRSQALAVLRSGGDLGLMLGSGVLGYLAHTYDLNTAANVGAMCILGGGLNFAFRATKPASRMQEMK